MTAKRLFASPDNGVRQTLELNCSAAHAFEVFTAQMGRWWPASHHIGAAPFVDIVIEPYQGGRWLERNADGEECAWGRVLVWDAPHTVVLSWHLGVDFTVDADPAHASEVVLRIRPQGAHACLVEFEHRHLERHGAGWEQLREAVGSERGWGGILEDYVQHATVTAAVPQP